MLNLRTFLHTQLPTSKGREWKLEFSHHSVTSCIC
uniref:Uncharacterized protein n=1 Tax=Arundo donax TaxID=35708 RepID=A0A0A8YTY5_ARUDO